MAIGVPVADRAVFLVDQVLDTVLLGRRAACCLGLGSVACVLEARFPPSRWLAHPSSVGTVCTFFLSGIAVTLLAHSR